MGEPRRKAELAELDHRTLLLRFIASLTPTATSTRCSTLSVSSTKTTTLATWSRSRGSCTRWASRRSTIRSAGIRQKKTRTMVRGSEQTESWVTVYHSKRVPHCPPRSFVRWARRLVGMAPALQAGIT